MVRYKPVLLGERKVKEASTLLKINNKLTCDQKKFNSTESSSDVKPNYPADPSSGRKLNQGQQGWKEGCLGDSSENMDEYFSDISFSSSESDIFSDVSLLDSVSLPTLDSMITSFTPPPESPTFLQEYSRSPAVPQEYLRSSAFLQDYSRSPFIHSTHNGVLMESSEHPSLAVLGVLDEPSLSVF